MQWIKLETNFWQSRTAYVLEKECGKNGIIIYLKLLAAIGKDIHTESDVKFAFKNGWTKSLKDWTHVCTTSAWCLSSWLTRAAHADVVMVTTAEDKRITLKFKNLEEFIHRDALSSKGRISNKELKLLSGRPVAPIDKIREDNIIKGIPKIFGSENSYRIPEFKISQAKRQQKELLEKHRGDGLAPLGPTTPK